MKTDMEISIYYRGYISIIFLLTFAIMYIFVFGFFIKSFSLIEPLFNLEIFWHQDSKNGTGFLYITIITSILLFLSFIIDRYFWKKYLNSNWLVLIIPASVNVFFSWLIAGLAGM